MKARLFAPAALALAASALAPAPAAAKPPRPFPVRHPTRDVEIAPLDVDEAIDGTSAVTAAPRLPLVAPPAPLEMGRASDKLSWSYETEGLRVVGAEGLPPDQSPQFRNLLKVPGARPKAKKAKKAPPPPRRAETETAWVRVEGAATPALVAFAWQAPESNFARLLSLPCRPWLEAPVRWPLRWETLRGDENSAPLWQVNDGWYDEKSCQLSLERKTPLRPAVLVRQGQTPAVLAAREDDAVIFLVAPTRSLVAHDLGGALRPSQGPFARVRVPVGPGQASTVVASFPGSTLANWWKRPNPPAPNAPVVRLGNEANLLEVRVDVSQAVAEREPTLAVQRVTDRPEMPAPPLPQPAPPPQLRSQQAPGVGASVAAVQRLQTEH